MYFPRGRIDSFSETTNYSSTSVRTPTLPLLGTPVAATSPVTERLARIYLDQSIWPLQDREEADLMRYFIDTLAPCFDLCDPHRHFATIVPHRASMCPVLLNAIYAASARHLARVRGFNCTVSDRYHQECLKHLIPMLNDSAAVMDENLLAATIILRFLEEVEVAIGRPDSESHLLGSHIFISAQESSTITGGLRQAAFWVGLRQEIYIAAIAQRSILPALSHCNIDRSLEAADDFTWANRIIVHCTDVIRYCYGDGDPSSGNYAELVRYCDTWMAVKPSSFAPMYFKERGEGSMFPEYWVLGDAVATALQHYYLARILLAAHNPTLPRLGPASLLAQQRVDDEIRDHVRSVCGLALSNPRAPPNFASALLVIASAGDRFVELKEQEALLQILVRTDEEHGWPSQRAQAYLKETWDWLK